MNCVCSKAFIPFYTFHNFAWLFNGFIPPDLLSTVEPLQFLNLKIWNTAVNSGWFINQMPLRYRWVWAQNCSVLSKKCVVKCRFLMSIQNKQLHTICWYCLLNGYHWLLWSLLTLKRKKCINGNDHDHKRKSFSVSGLFCYPISPN